MPTYEYRCKQCGHEFEEFQSMTATPLRKCPRCAKNRLERLIGTGAGVLFKGSGFWQTDYRSDSYKEAAKKESSAGESKSESKPETKTESKSEAKTETKAEPKPAAPKAEKPQKTETKSGKK